ncbi:MAG: maleylpyruvate isomerase family mycothiol-dependent enzyme [Actinomycetota bacterium]
MIDDTNTAAWIRETSDELAEIAATVGAQASVPACPGWTMRQLVAHVISGLSGWYTYNLTHGAEPLDYAASWSSQPDLPPNNAGRLTRLVESADRFTALVSSIDLDAPCYVFQSRRTARAWLQRAATETAIHLRDAQEVVGEVAEWPPDRAAASVDETLRVMWHGALLLRGDLSGVRVPDAPISVVATDLGLMWTVHKGADDFLVERTEAATVATEHSVAGAANDLIP